MDENMAFFMDKLKELVPFAKEREQELTSDMISDFFGHMPLTEEQMEKIYDYLESNGIFVDRSNDEPDRRMLDEAEEEIDPNDISYRRESERMIRSGCISKRLGIFHF